MSYFSPYRISSTSVQRFSLESVLDRVIFAFIILYNSTWICDAALYTYYRSIAVITSCNASQFAQTVCRYANFTFVGENNVRKIEGKIFIIRSTHCRSLAAAVKPKITNC